MTYRITLFLSILFLFLLTGTTDSSLCAQATFDLRLQLTDVDCAAGTACYAVQVRSAGGTSWGLAGQNYRLYYDASLAAFQSGTSQLGGDYDNLVVVQDQQDVDASAIGGSLAFAPTLGFLNFHIDLSDPAAGGATLPATGDWVTTAELCFTLEGDVLSNPGSCLEVVWARDGATNEYGNSFVQISEWVGANNTQPAAANSYDDLDSGDGDASCLTALCQADYDIRLQLADVDCAAGTACYAVQVRSAGGTSWGLAGQNYRLYYDASLAAFQSGASQLGGDYDNLVVVQDQQDVDASAVGGSLAFAPSLGFLNFHIDLSDPAAGGATLPATGDWVTTAELCFTLEGDVLSNPGSCLEVVWARDGATNEYGNSFVQISEWVGANNTQPAAANSYDDLDSGDGDASCLTALCQADYDIRLQLADVDCAAGTACYAVQVRSADGTSWGLAGQNYRLYYDASLAAFQSGASQLGGDYDNLVVVQDQQDVDASAVGGSLAFAPTLGFLNFHIDLSDPAAGGATLPATGDWVTTAELCFTLEGDVLSNPGSCLEVVWARDGATNEYGNSFVQISEWVGANNTQPAAANSYDDLDSGDGNASCLASNCSEPFDLRLTLKDIDCSTYTACYEVQLRSAGGTSWGLAGQNYRLYYDGAAASYVSGSSSLGAAYDNLVLVQDVQNTDASASGGPLSYQANLSFLNFHIDLSDPSVGGIDLPANSDWVAIAELCFDIDPALFDDNNACFEAVWARDGLTDPYGNAFVQISEWVSANVTKPAVGQTYDDLEGSDGEGSCFLVSCPQPDEFVNIGGNSPSWFDENGNGIQDPGEPYLEGLQVTLYDANTNMPVTTDYLGNPVTPLQTDANGQFSFDTLPPGEYYVVFDLQTLPDYPSLQFVPPHADNNSQDALDSDASFPHNGNPWLGQSPPISLLTGGSSLLTLAAGASCALSVEAGSPASICGNNTLDISELNPSVNLLPGMSAEWSTSGDGEFLDAGGASLGTTADFGQAAFYSPGANDRASGQAPLSLSSDTGGPCGVLMDEVILTVRNVSCGNFPWDGN